MSSLSNRRRAALLLGIYTAAGLAAVVFARLFFSSSIGIRCPFLLATGWYCPGCGATRAVYWLLNFRLLRSFLSNPLPLLLAAFMLLLIGWELANLIAGARRPFRLLLPFTYAALGVVLAVCLLRNFGALPPL